MGEQCEKEGTENTFTFFIKLRAATIGSRYLICPRCVNNTLNFILFYRGLDWYYLHVQESKHIGKPPAPEFIEDILCAIFAEK